MADRKALVDPNDTPEDVATLYSWANLHGAKYRDFSASRAQTREKARQRVQEAMEAERRRSHEETEAQKNVEVLRAAEAARQAEASRQAEMFARESAQRAAAEVAVQQPIHGTPLPGAAAPQYAWQPGSPAFDVPPAQHPPVTPAYVPPPSYAPQAAPYASPAAPSYPVPAAPVAAAPPPAPAPSQASNYFAQQPAAVPTNGAGPINAGPMNPGPMNGSGFGGNGFGPPNSTPAPQLAFAPQPPAQTAYPQQGREEPYFQNRTPWTSTETREATPRPAWLTSERTEAPAPPAVPQLPDDLQASRDRLTSRWFALKGVFSGNVPQAEAAPLPPTSRAPLLAVFSLAGGVGKTSLVATLGRALSARGERVLLVDTAAFGLLPFFFGARDQRPGVLRTFTPPGVSGDAPIQMLTVDPDTLGPENAAQEILTQEISRNGRAASRIIVDLATASGATTRRILRMSPTVLVPVIPDMSSVVSVSSIDGFFQRNPSPSGQPVMPFYILNQFDPSLPLHLDVREVLREQLGDRLLPFVMRRTPAVSEALAEGMTVVDYAPNSTVAEDFGSLAVWVKSLAAPATNGFRGVRWSER